MAADSRTGGKAVGRTALGLAVLLCARPPVRLSAQDYRAQALRILKTVPLIDGHNDIPDAIRARGGLDSVDFAMARTAADVERNFKAGKISCLIGIEGGHAIENSLGALRMFAALGVRYVTLTHWRSLSWATASTDTARRGLSTFGRDVVHEMNRLGILVDLSHVNDATMSDALHTTHAPVMFSHSSARALTGHARDVPDSILKLVPKNGGIVMVNFNPGFVSEAVRLYDDSMEARIRSLRATGVDPTTVADSTKVWAARAPKATLAHVADHK